jgi:pimeloyl-ACP methyl ester carboxylesterase
MIQSLMVTAALGAFACTGFAQPRIEKKAPIPNPTPTHTVGTPAAKTAAASGTTAKASTKRGALAFKSEFNPNAVGLNQKNAYLLMYIANAIYPEQIQRLGDDQSEATFIKLNQNKNNIFEGVYRDRLSYLFESPSFKYISNTNNPDGYDPEVMVIDSSNAVFVVFRGTDRVGSAKPDSFRWSAGEWLDTDFDLAMIDPGEKIPGKVHKGFWFSLRLVRDDILSTIHKFNPDGKKKVWVTGHSLGAAYTQVFAAYAESKGVQIQGVYAFAAPHVGNREFVNYLNSKVPNGRLQRFDFVDDPITLLGPYALGFERAGVRNWYSDLTSLSYAAPERNILDDARVFPSIAQAGAEAATGSLHIDWLSLDTFCYHHTEWYLRSAYNQVAKSERGDLPAPFPFALPTPTTSVCNCAAIARAHTSDLGKVFLETGEQIVQGAMKAIETGVTAVGMVIEDSAKKAAEAGQAVEKAAEQAAQTISYNADQLLKNATGSAIAEGTYFIRCLQDGKYLDVSGSCFGEDGCKTQLWSLGKSASNNKFRIVREAPYYRIEIGDKVLDADAEDLFDNGCRVQTWSRNMVPGINQNQKWLFYKVRGNMYLIVNAANLKVLDANNKETNQNGGHVKLWRAISNDPTQVWLLEKAK